MREEGRVRSARENDRRRGGRPPHAPTQYRVYCAACLLEKPGPILTNCPTFASTAFTTTRDLLLPCPSASVVFSPPVHRLNLLHLNACTNFLRIWGQDENIALFGQRLTVCDGENMVDVANQLYGYAFGAGLLL